MQTFSQYLLDIFKAEDDNIDTVEGTQKQFRLWVSTLDQDTLFNYANDYAKECVREYAMKLHIQNKKNMQNTQEDTGAFKYDWAYEEFEEVINNNLK